MKFLKIFIVFSLIFSLLTIACLSEKKLTRRQAAKLINKMLDEDRSVYLLMPTGKDIKIVFKGTKDSLGALTEKRPLDLHKFIIDKLQIFADEGIIKFVPKKPFITKEYFREDGYEMIKYTASLDVEPGKMLKSVEYKKIDKKEWIKFTRSYSCFNFIEIYIESPFAFFVEYYKKSYAGIYCKVADRKLLGITGIHLHAPTKAQAYYEWKYELNQIGKVFAKILSGPVYWKNEGEIYQSSRCFALYDDGWRLLHEDEI